MLQGTREGGDGHQVTGESSQISHNDGPQLFRSSDCGDAHVGTIHLTEGDENADVLAALHIIVRSEGLQ